MNNILSKIKREKNDSGFTLIEMIVYVALVGIVSVLIYGTILFIYYDNKRIADLTIINSNAYSVMERIRYEIENADHIYLPTSNLKNYDDYYDLSKTAQLSLATKIGVSSHEDITFVDIYLENETIFLKKEEMAEPIALTSSSVAISELSFYYHLNGSRESITIDATVEPKDSVVLNSSIRLISTIALRSF